jgi:transcriptional regulator
MPKPSDLLQGTLDLLILKTLSREPLHGWAIAKRIQLLSDEVLSVQQGSLYPALHRLENQGWITAEWKSSEHGRDAKVYELTRKARGSLRVSSSRGTACRQPWVCCCSVRRWSPGSCGWPLSAGARWPQRHHRSAGAPRSCQPDRRRDA